MKNPIVITCQKAVPPFLVRELGELGFPVFAEGIASVVTEGTMTDAMLLNLSLRTGQRVLYLLKEFEADTPDELYREVRKIPWEKYIRKDGYICITSAVESPSITDTRYANLKCKDAIVDRMTGISGQRPDSGPARDRAVIHLYWMGSQCYLYLDTSGEPLSQRGYRKIPFRAPMQETLAAAVLSAAGWDGTGNLVNPMCGSGTLAIEAALISLDRAPGLLRANFGFMHLTGYAESVWQSLRRKAKEKVKRSLRGRIIATDRDGRAIEAARKNAETAGVGHLIEFSVCDFADTPVPAGGGIVVMNPEYGQRMGEVRELEQTYREIGDFFKKSCSGYTGYVFTGNLDLAKKIGLRTKRRILFFNSSIECRLLEYELYEGSRKGRDSSH